MIYSSFPFLVIKVFIVAGKIVNTLDPSIRRQRQMDFYEFQGSWSYTERPCLNQSKQTRNTSLPVLK